MTQGNEENSLEKQQANGDMPTAEATVDGPRADARAPQGEAEMADLGTDLPGLQAELEHARTELADARDQMVRALADAQNVRRRAEKDVSNARLFALEGFSRDLLPVIDNLERAVESSNCADPSTKAIAEGVELTLKSFLDVLKRHHVEQLEPLSEPFDPDFHQAISTVQNPEVEANTVLDVVQKGYTLNGRLLRAAMVVVSS